jgi:hypothetical protein
MTLKCKIFYFLFFILFSLYIHCNELSITSNIQNQKQYKIYIIYNNKYQLTDLKHLIYYFLKEHNYQLLIQYSIFDISKIETQIDKINYYASNIINDIYSFNPNLIISVGNHAAESIILKKQLYLQFPTLILHNTIDINYIFNKNKISFPEKNLFVIQSEYALKPLIDIFFISDTPIYNFYFLYNNSLFSTYYINKFNHEIINLQKFIPSLNFQNIFIDDVLELKNELSKINYEHSIIISLLSTIYNDEKNKNINSTDIHKIIFDFKQNNFLLTLDDISIKKDILTFGLLHDKYTIESNAFYLFKKYIFKKKFDNQTITLKTLSTTSIKNIQHNIFLKHILNNKSLFNIIIQ